MIRALSGLVHYRMHCPAQFEAHSRCSESIHWAGNSVSGRAGSAQVPKAEGGFVVSSGAPGVFFAAQSPIQFEICHFYTQLDLISLCI